MTVSNKAEEIDAPPRGRGRPRREDIDAGIRAATWALLDEAGYDGLTFEGVAERAGCSRPALYRRFSSKAELVLSVVTGTSRALEPDLEPDADPRAALIAHAGTFLAYLDQSGGATLALSVARRRDAALSQALEAVFDNERGYYTAALKAACRDLPGTFDEVLLADSLIGAIMFRVAMRGAPLSAAELEALVDAAIAFARSQAAVA